MTQNPGYWYTKTAARPCGGTLEKSKPVSLPTLSDAFVPQWVRFPCFIRSTERTFCKNVQPASIGCSSRAWVFPNKYFATQKWYIYIRVKTPLVSTMRLLKTPPKFDNHFARMIVRFQAQLEADGCFSARKSSEFAFRCKQNELSSPLFLPKFPSFFLASCRKYRIFKTFCWHGSIFVVVYLNNLI